MPSILPKRLRGRHERAISPPGPGPGAVDRFFRGLPLSGNFRGDRPFHGRGAGGLGLGFVLEKRLSPMPLFTAVLVLIFGGLTLYLKNDIFIKMKPTVLYAFFGATLIGGLAFK